MTMKIENFPLQKRPLVKAIIKAGNASIFARSIGTTRQVVDGWLYKCKLAPPAKYCRQIEALTDGEINRSELRPDLFGKIEISEKTDSENLETCIFILRGLLDKANNKKKGVA